METRARTDEIFGKYRLVRKIADGGMASIYLASSIGPGGFEKPCAVKRIRPEYSSSSAFRDMLVREAKIAALLAHPNIVQVFDFGEVDGEYFLTMEWVEGEALHRIIGAESRAKRRLDLSAALTLGIDVARALEYLGSGVRVDGQTTMLVHRDVSPSNILVSTTGAVKLTDFGIVKVLEAPAGTEAGVVKGKYAYMSPEQLQGLPLDSRSDIFSLGVVLFETITTKRLFRRADIASTIAAVLGARVPAASTLNPSVPPRLDRTLARALSKRRDERHANAAELIAELEAVLGELPGASSGSAKLGQLARRRVDGAPDDRPADTVATGDPHHEDGLLGDVPLEPNGHMLGYGSGTDVAPELGEAAFDADDVDGSAMVWWAAAAMLAALVASLAFWLIVLD